MSHTHKNILLRPGRYVCYLAHYSYVALRSFTLLLLGGLELLDLPDEIGLLVVELLVLGAVGVELGEEVHELVLVAQEYVQYRLRLVRVRHEHLEVDM